MSHRRSSKQPGDFLITRSKSSGSPGSSIAGSRTESDGITAHLGVKDEVELIEPCIDHLRAIGVDLIIACDMGSTDGTYEILEKHRSDDGLWAYRVTELDPDTEETWTRAAMALIKSAKADWAFFLDADEFWIPASGCLKQCRALAEADALSVPRYSIPLAPGGPAMPNLLVPEAGTRICC